METALEKIHDCILNGDAEMVRENVQQALDSSVEPAVILNEGMIAAMQEVGRLFEECEYFIPDMLVAARAMQAGLNILRPRLILTDFKPLGKVVIGTVKGDLHDIGKNLVCMMLEGAGFEIVDLGVDVSAEKFAEAVWEHKPDLIGISALLTTTMAYMRTIIETLRAGGPDGGVKIMVGGAPVTEAYAIQIGADGFAPDASRAVSVAKSLL